MKMATLSPLWITVAKGQYSPEALLPSGCQTVECTVQPSGTIHSDEALPVFGMPSVAVCGVLVAAQPDQTMKFSKLRQNQ
jgi:hypothetical protein